MYFICTHIDSLCDIVFVCTYVGTSPLMWPGLAVPGTHMITVFPVSISGCNRAVARALTFSL